MSLDVEFLRLIDATPEEAEAHSDLVLTGVPSFEWTAHQSEASAATASRPRRSASRLVPGPDGVLEATPTERQGSHMDTGICGASVPPLTTWCRSVSDSDIDRHHGGRTRFLPRGSGPIRYQRPMLRKECER